MGSGLFEDLAVVDSEVVSWSSCDKRGNRDKL